MENYQKTIDQLIKFLEGKKKSLLQEMEKEMKETAKEQDFEKAARIKKQIQDLKYITSPYFIDLSFPKKETKREIEELKRVLGLKRVFRIEGFDVSNIQGKMATGSMVVFLNGEPEKEEYRRFKIRMKEEPNDVGMMKEIVTRRLNHPEWEYPDLLVIDGGKGQVRGVLEVLRKRGIKIPVIGLAKKEEKIIVPKFQIPNSKFQIKCQQLVLPKDSPALHLLQRVRDEAHRFALSYHRKLRVKTLYL